MAETLINQDADCGVLICGTGVGMSISANRFAEVRAALIHDISGAKLSRQHNDANILCLGARVITPENAAKCLDVFLQTEFDGGRHEKRISKLSELKKNKKENHSK